MNVSWTVSTDFMGIERRLQRDDDRPSLAVLRVVQQTHTEMLSKLSDTTQTIATAVAVQATTVGTIATTQAQHAITLNEHDKAIAANALRDQVAQAETRGWRRAIGFGVPVIITMIVAIVSAAAYVLERLPK